MRIAKNQQTEHMSVSKKTISDTLTSIRKNGEKVQTLFELLENDDGFYDTEQFVKIALGGRNYNGIDGLDTQYQSFCEAYTIRLLEKYVRPQQKLYLLLAAFGFLPNYRNLSVKERYENYVKEKPNMRFKKGTKVVSELK